MKLNKKKLGLKIIVFMNSGEKFCSKNIKRPKDQTVTFEEHGMKAGGQKQKQGTAHDPCTQSHKRGSQSPKLPVQPVLWTHPYYHPIEGRSSPLSGSKQAKERVGALTSCFCGRGSNKALPEKKKASRPEGKRQTV